MDKKHSDIEDDNTSDSKAICMTSAFGGTDRKRRRDPKEDEAESSSERYRLELTVREWTADLLGRLEAMEDRQNDLEVWIVQVKNELDDVIRKVNSLNRQVKRKLST